MQLALAIALDVVRAIFCTVLYPGLDILPHTWLIKSHLKAKQCFIFTHVAVARASMIVAKDFHCKLTDTLIKVIWRLSLKIGM